LSCRKNLIESNCFIGIAKQCELLSINRSTFYYLPEVEFTDDKLEILNVMDEIYTKYSFYGYRRIWKDLLEKGYEIGKDRVLKYMVILGLEAIYPKKKTSIPNKNHMIYSYLLNDIEITRPNQVWCADISYLRIQNGFCYIVVIMDWYSRYILSWRISNSMDVEFCKVALEEALEQYSHPEIFNTDQGSQFTSVEFTRILLNNKIKISMDSKGRAFDNIMIERFFRSLKYELVYLNEYNSISEIKKSVKDYMHYYNNVRKHSSFDYQKLVDVYDQRKEYYNDKRLSPIVVDIPQCARIQLAPVICDDSTTVEPN